MILTRLIAECVADPRWGGGLHQEKLARICHREPWEKDFRFALWNAYRAGKIDLCGRYVVTPPGVAEPAASPQPIPVPEQPPAVACAQTALL